MKNEKTSDEVASKAGRLLGEDLDTAVKWLADMERDLKVMMVRLPRIIGILGDAKSVAASSLTQSPDKPA